MRLQIVLSSSLIVMLASGGCTAQAPPDKKKTVDSIRLIKGQPFYIEDDSVRSEDRLLVSPERDGVLFAVSEIQPPSEKFHDVSGERRVYLFVPDDLVTDAVGGKAVVVDHSGGLIAKEYSRNDAFSDRYCIQNLEVGSVSIRLSSDAKSLEVDSNLKNKPIEEPTDARCDASEFVEKASFPISGFSRNSLD